MVSQVSSVCLLSISTEYLTESVNHCNQLTDWAVVLKILKPLCVGSNYSFTEQHSQLVALNGSAKMRWCLVKVCLHIKSEHEIPHVIASQAQLQSSVQILLWFSLMILF